MARLQILELPEGPDDTRPPFVLVVDESAPQRVIIGMDHGRVRDHWQDAADRIGARGAIVTAETVEIPANDVSVEFREGVQQHLGEMYETARRSLSESETLGHTLLQRAENADGRSRAMEVQRDRANRRAEQAEAGRVAADNVLRAVCEVFGGPHQDPVVKTRETLARANAAEAKLQAFAEERQREFVDRMDEITDALGLDRLRDWGEIVSAIRMQRQVAADGEHVFGEPGYQDPQRCARCGLGRDSWMRQRDTRTCSTVRADAESGHNFRPIGARDELACLRCGVPRIEWAVRRDTPQCDVVRQGGE
ncbi:hypothetical protein [Streptomyces sp. NPDC014623]|uniref:hypothetical protein n=1 Tax=Streptomyces sp. NPDC014623 TaxID=3364875 RepID=UPI0037000F7A